MRSIAWRWTAAYGRLRTKLMQVSPDLIVPVGGKAGQHSNDAVSRQRKSLRGRNGH